MGLGVTSEMSGARDWERDVRLRGEAGDLCLVSDQARQSSSLDGAVRVAPRRDGCGKQKAPPARRAHRGATMAWLTGPSRAGEEISSLIVQVVGDPLNGCPATLQFYAPGANWRERMGIEPTWSLFPDPTPVLKTGPGTSHGNAPGGGCYSD